MVYDLLADELQSGLHAVSINAKTPQEMISRQPDLIPMLVYIFLWGSFLFIVVIHLIAI